MTWVSTASAVDREAAWLSTSGDGLPALLAADGGPWDVVQAYVPRSPAGQRQLWVTRVRLKQPRISNGRIRTQHEFRLLGYWPLRSGLGSAEDEQRAFDAAIDAVLQRVAGTLGDHTHGGRFLSAAEDPREVDVEFEPAQQTLSQVNAFLAAITYNADDMETVG